MIYSRGARKTTAGVYTRGKSGQHRIRQLLTATGGNSRESATETYTALALSRGKGEKSGVRARSAAWRHGAGVNPVGCKECYKTMIRRCTLTARTEEQSSG